MADAPINEEHMEHYIHLCLSEQDVPEEELDQLEEIMNTHSQKAKDIALRLLDESMIRSWFRSQADISFINEVQRRLNLRFQDQDFVKAVMHRVKESIDATNGQTGATLHHEQVKSVSILKYIIAPLCAAILYVAFVHHEAVLNFFTDSDSFFMTVDDMNGRPGVISEGKNKDVILKMVIRPGDTLSTNSSDILKMRYPDNSQIDLHANTIAVVVDAGSRKELQLLRGSIQSTITPQNDEAPLTIKVSFAEIQTVSGKNYIQLKDGLATVKVLDGSAKIDHPGSDRVVKLQAGETAIIDGSGISTTARNSNK
jgi:hypothetical protein